jgi:hypothetical protein
MAFKGTVLLLEGDSATSFNICFYIKKQIRNLEPNIIIPEQYLVD